MHDEIERRRVGGREGRVLHGVRDQDSSAAGESWATAREIAACRCREKTGELTRGRGEEAPEREGAGGEWRHAKWAAALAKTKGSQFRESEDGAGEIVASREEIPLRHAARKAGCEGTAKAALEIVEDTTEIADADGG